jgi:hypothetical protein
MYVDVTQSTTDILRLRRLFQEGRLNENGSHQRRVRLLDDAPLMPGKEPSSSATSASIRPPDL